MIKIKNTRISEELIEKQFVCDLNACKGSCCMKGDFGAPLEEKEVSMLEEMYGAIEPYLTAEGKQTVEKQGKYLTYENQQWVSDKQGRNLLGEAKEWTTPLMDNKACAYTVFENGIAKCGIEKAYFDGKITFRKPLSCHLYPVRINKTSNVLEKVRYDKWSICKPACKNGENLKVPVYKFVKDALIRKYGEEWYNELDRVANTI